MCTRESGSGWLAAALQTTHPSAGLLRACLTCHHWRDVANLLPAKFAVLSGSCAHASAAPVLALVGRVPTHREWKGHLTSPRRTSPAAPMRGFLSTRASRRL